MIQTNISDAGRYYGIHPRLRQLFEYLQSHDLMDMPLGRITIDGDDLFINNVESELLPHQAQKLEVHRRYIDVHIPLNGAEIVGWSPLNALGESDKPFDEDKDFALFSQLAQAYTNIVPGQCLIAFPEDAHAPIIGYGKLRKAIAKIAIK